MSNVNADHDESGLQETGFGSIDLVDIIDVKAVQAMMDDDESIVHLEKQMLERLGYRTTSFTSSVDALDAFEKDPSQFDLVITDMHMPELTGVQLAKKIIFARPELPVILCTGFSERVNREKAEAMGIKGLLMKPLEIRDIAQKVRDVLV